MRKFGYTIALALLLTGMVFAGVITGKVVNSATSAPVANALLYAMRANVADTATMFAVTDAQGRYTLAVPSGMSFYIKATHPEFNPLSKGPVTPDSSGIAIVNFELLPLTSSSNYISGLVKSSLTNAVIVNAQVSLYGASATGGTYTTYSNAEGRYKFSPVTPGVYRLKAVRQGYRDYNFPDLISVTASTQNPNQHISMLPSDSVSVNPTVLGVVYQMSSAGTSVLLPGAKVKLMAADSTSYTAISDSMGVFRIVNVRPATYTAICSKEGFQSVSKYPVVVGGDVVSLTFYLQPNVTVQNLISGYVKDAQSVLPVQGVTVSLYPANGTVVSLFTYTDAAGKYQFLNIPAGSYRLTASKTGYITYSRPELLQVTAATQLTNINVALQKQDSTTLTALLSGVTYTAGITTVQVPLPGVKLSLFKTGSDTLFRSTYSDSTGTYRFPNVPVGSYAVVCVKEGYQSVTKNSIQLPAGTTMLNFILPPLQTSVGVIKGKVYTDSLNTPVSGAIIDFIPADPNLPTYTIRTTETGAYTKEVMVGRYYVACSVPGTNTGAFYREYYDNVLMLSQATPVQAVAGTPRADVNFGVPRVVGNGFIFTVSGKVLSAAGTVVANALVRISPAVSTADTASFTGYTNANGEYAFTITVNRPVPQVSFVVSASKEGYLIQFYNNKPTIYLADVLVAQPGSAFRNINFNLQAATPVPGAYAISGKVADTLGNPLPGAYVITSQAGTGQVVLSFADSLGNYRTPLLRQGSYYVLFAREGYIPQYYNRALTWERATPVKIINAPVTGINGSLFARVLSAGNSMVAGVVSGSSGEPLSGAMVTISSDNGTVINYAMTDALGNYELPGLAEGTYTVTVSLIQYYILEKTVTCNPSQGNIQKVDFELVNVPLVSIGGGTTQAPVSHLIVSAYPNPFNPATAIQLLLPEPGTLRVTVYNAYGGEVAELTNGYYSAGMHTVQFNAASLPSGVYVYRVLAGRYAASGKLVLQK